MFEKELDTIEKDLDILEEYRKIEKELGIDLLTLFKALRTGVYIKQYGEIEHYYLKLFGDGINFCLTTYVGVKVILNKYDSLPKRSRNWPSSLIRHTDFALSPNAK